MRNGHKFDCDNLFKHVPPPQIHTHIHIHTKYTIPCISRGTGGGQLPLLALQLREKCVVTRDLLGMAWVEAFLKYKTGSSEGEQEGISTMPARMLKLLLMVEGSRERETHQSYHINLSISYNNNNYYYNYIIAIHTRLLDPD